MKHVAGLMCLSSVYTGVLWIEYQTALLFGVGCFLFAAGSALTLVATVLYRAPEGGDRRDGFHVRPRDCCARLARYIRFSQPARVRQ